MAHHCVTCGASYGQRFHLNRHVREKHEEMKCGLCSLILFGSQAFEKHQKTHGIKTGYDCSLCGKTLSRKDNLKQHQRTCDAAGANVSPLRRPFTLLNPDVTFASTKRCDLEYKVRTIASGFNGAVETYRIDFNREMRTVDTLNILKAATFAMEDRLNNYRERSNALKFNLSVHAVFKKIVGNVYTEPPICFSTQAFEVYHGSDIHELLKSSNKQLVSKIDTFKSNGSGWILDSLVKIWVIQ